MIPITVSTVYYRAKVVHAKQRFIHIVIELGMHIYLRKATRLLIKGSQRFHGALLNNEMVAHENSPGFKISQAKDVVSWTTLISSLARHASSSESALFEASRMCDCGIKPSGYILVCMIKASTNLGWLSYGQQLHCYILCSGFIANVFVSTSLVNFYVKHDLFDEAHKLFVEIPGPNVVSWNSLICGYVQNGKFGRALALVLELDGTDLQVDSFTFTAALGACGQLGLLGLGQSLHSKIVKSGSEWIVAVSNSLIDMYGKCRFVNGAIQVFDETIDKDVVSWNSVIAATAGNCHLQEAFKYLAQMPSPDTISYNEVINGIVQFGDIEDAIQVLSQMPNPNSSSWNTIIAGYVNRDQAEEALEFFSKMHLVNVRMDQFTASSILRAVAGLSALKWGTLIHGCVIKLGLDAIIVVGSALIDMYSKCGQVNYGESIFNSLPKRNLISYNAMISGYSHNGNTNEVIKLFEELRTEHSIEPDDITFLSVLSACTKDEEQWDTGIQYFESMVFENGIKPTLEHCTCMIRLLGQKGQVRAERMIHDFGFGLCGLVWKALLNACYGCGELRVAEVAAAKVIKLDGADEFVLVVLSNMYAIHGRWRDVSSIRRLMRRAGLTKKAGCSWIEVENVIPSRNK